MLLIFFTSSCSNEQIVKEENNIKSKNIIIENYYQPHYELIEKNYKDNPRWMKNLKTTNSMLTNIFHDIKWNKITPKFSDDLILEYEKLIQFIISQWQYVDVQNLIEYQYMVRFNENNHFDEIKKELIEKNVIFSFHDQVLLTAEQVEKSLNKIPKCNIW